MHVLICSVKGFGVTDLSEAAEQSSIVSQVNEDENMSSLKVRISPTCMVSLH